MEHLLLVYHRGAVCAHGWVRSGLPRACGAGLLIWGMLLPSEQSKWGLSKIKFHRSEGLRVVESSQNRSLCGSHAVWRQLQSLLSRSLCTLVPLPVRYYAPQAISFPFSARAKDVKWVAFYLTNPPKCCYELVHAPLVHRCSRAPALLYCDFISVGGTKNNCWQFTHSKCHTGTKGDSDVNKWD